MTSNLVEIAALQQSIAYKTKQNLGINNTPNELTQGKYSDRANPVTAPWVTMPDGGYPFSNPGTIATPVIGSGWIDVIGPNAPSTTPGEYTMQVPNGSSGVIKQLVNFYNGSGFISGSGQLMWRILVNGQSVRGYDQMLVQYGGSSPFPGTISGIRLAGGDYIQFQVQNVGLIGGGTQIACFLGGWYYPSVLG